MPRQMRSRFQIHPAGFVVLKRWTSGYAEIYSEWMCGRAYETYTEDELYFRYLNERDKRKPLGLAPNFNMSPTQLSPLVRKSGDETEIALFRWGLVPSWAKDLKSASRYSLINARGEDILEKRSYKVAFKMRRCIVPLSGFIEWKREEKSKRPFAISLKNEPIMSVAGIWEHWESKDSGEVVDSFSIITTCANEFMQEIHDRMPVILDRKNEAQWLDPENQDTEALIKLLKPCPPEHLRAYEISTLINSPKNNRAEVLVPLK